MPEAECSTSDPSTDHGNRVQQFVYPLIVWQSLDTINISTPLPVEDLSAIPRDVTLNNLQKVYELVDQTMLPSKHSGLNRAAGAMMQHIVSDAGILNAFLFGQLIRNKAEERQSTKETDFHALACHTEVVKRISSCLDDPQNACSDSTMLMVMVMASSGEVHPTNDTARGPAQGPLKSVGRIDLYGGPIDPDTTHEQGLARMIELRGGQDPIQLPGLKQMVSYEDLIYQSRRLKRPHLPFFPHHEEDYDSILQSLRRPDRTLQTLGSGFWTLPAILPGSNLLALTTALERLSLYTLGVEDYITGSPFCQSLLDIADERNLCHHGILSLIPQPHSPREHALVRACRLAATVYSFLCVFPMPSAPFAKLATMLKKCLSTATFSHAWKDALELAVWIITMAAIAAIGMEEREWFIAVLDRCLSRLRIESWEALKELLLKFLWLPSTNDADGYDLWLEVEASNPFKLGQTVEDVSPESGGGPSP